MLDAGGGGGYGGTDWSGYDVVRMWSALESQQTDPHWKLVAGWRKTFELTSMHLSRLQTYRDELSEAWPPRPGTAAEAYVQRLDSLIDHVRQTHDAAVANYDAFAGATGAISSTRYELKKIFDEYVANQAKLDQYAKQVASANERTKSGTPQPSPTPSPSPGPPPVPTGRQDQLNYQARSLMFRLSGELIQARAAIRTAPPFKPGAGYGEDATNYGGAGNGLAVPPPPVIPPVVTTHPTTVGHTAPPPPPAPPNQTPVGSVLPTGNAGGPVLGGAGPLPPANLNPTLPPQVPTVPPPPPNTGIIGPPLPPAITPVGKSAPSGLIGPRPPIGPGQPVKPGMGRSVPLPRPMPPGGVIGSQPIGGRSPAGRPLVSRVNPVGGVIGGAEAGTGQGARTVAPGARGATGRRVRGGGYPAAEPERAYGATTARAGYRPEEDEEREAHWDPDNPWETDEGVAPVVRPPRVGRVDPGPAIGYHP